MTVEGAAEMALDVPVAALTVTEILQPKERGEPVNAHIVPAVSEPAPDYEAMRRLVSPVERKMTSDERNTDPAPTA